MEKPLMPKATAVWLIQNTALTFDQIADFCGLHPLEVQGIADGEVAVGMVGLDPVTSGQLSQQEIDRCAADPSARLTIAHRDIPMPAIRTKGPRYTPVSKRQDKPDAIAWLLRHHPELTDAQIQRLIGTTKITIQKVRDRTHWNSPNIRPKDPVLLGLCTQTDLNGAVDKAKRLSAARQAGERAEAHIEPGAESGGESDGESEGESESAPKAEESDQTAEA